jgi:hypothetical protein
LHADEAFQRSGNRERGAFEQELAREGRAIEFTNFQDTVGHGAVPLLFFFQLVAKRRGNLPMPPGDCGCRSSSGSGRTAYFTEDVPGWSTHVLQAKRAVPAAMINSKLPGQRRWRSFTPRSPVHRSSRSIARRPLRSCKARLRMGGWRNLNPIGPRARNCWLSSLPTVKPATLTKSPLGLSATPQSAASRSGGLRRCRPDSLSFQLVGSC